MIIVTGFIGGEDFRQLRGCHRRDDSNVPVLNALYECFEESLTPPTQKDYRCVACLSLKPAGLSIALGINGELTVALSGEIQWLVVILHRHFCKMPVICIRDPAKVVKRLINYVGRRKRTATRYPGHDILGRPIQQYSLRCSGC